MVWDPRISNQATRGAARRTPTRRGREIIAQRWRHCRGVRPTSSAVAVYARRFASAGPPAWVTPDEMRDAARAVPVNVRRAIAVAARNIRRVAARQVPRGWSFAPSAGVRVAQRVLPLDRVGCYVPGGRYPLPSSLLMTALPARVAGVREIIAVCPRPDATIMSRRSRSRVSRLFSLGRATHCALAYGRHDPCGGQDRRPGKLSSLPPRPCVARTAP